VFLNQERIILKFEIIRKYPLFKNIIQ